MKEILAVTTDIRKCSYRYREVVAILPDHYRELLAKNRAKVEEPARQLFNWMMQYGRHYLDSTTLQVFQFIYWRTYTFYKRAELISKSQFLGGVWDTKTNESRCAPATTSSHTLYKALNTLEDLGFVDWYAVKINGSDVTSLFEINIKNVLDHDLREQEVGKLRDSKKKSAEIIDFPSDSDSIMRARRWSKVAPPPVEQRCTTEDYNNKKVTKTSSCSVPRNENEIDFKGAKASIERAVARVTEKREAKVRRAARAPGFISLSALNAIWQSAMIARYGSCTVSGLTHKEYGMFKRIAKAHAMTCTWKEFCEWVIGNWVSINRESRELDKYKKDRHGDWSLKDSEKIFLGTEHPDLFMMVRNLPKLLKRYSQHALKGVSLSREESAEVIALRKVADAATKRANTATTLLKKALANTAVPAARIRRSTRSVKIVNPDTDLFFDEADASLPEWK